MNPAQRIRNAFRRLMTSNDDKDARIAALEKELAPFRAIADELDPPATPNPDPPDVAYPDERTPESGNGAESAVAE